MQDAFLLHIFFLFSLELTFVRIGIVNIDGTLVFRPGGGAFGACRQCELTGNPAAAVEMKCMCDQRATKWWSGGYNKGSWISLGMFT